MSIVYQVEICGVVMYVCVVKMFRTCRKRPGRPKGFEVIRKCKLFLEPNGQYPSTSRQVRGGTQPTVSHVRADMQLQVRGQYSLMNSEFEQMASTWGERVGKGR